MTQAYNAFGNQLSPDADDTNPFRYCCGYYDDETGMYYLISRYYSAGTGRFTQQDPIKDGTNWYIYCANDPVLFFDPFGLMATPEEGAAMSEHIYHHSKMPSDSELKTVAGWKLHEIYNGWTETGKNSVRMGVYIRKNDDADNPSEYAIVYKGTGENVVFDEKLSNLKNNVLAYASSSSEDIDTAIELARNFVRDNGVRKDGKEVEISFYGHSKGGGEAIAAVLSTGKNAITYNAANFKLSNYGVYDDGISVIDNCYIKGEFLHEMIGKARYGKSIELPTVIWAETHWQCGEIVYTPNAFDNHKIEIMKKALKIDYLLKTGSN